MSLTWQGKEVNVDILYSKAGIATQVLLIDRKRNNALLLDCGDGTTRDIINHSIDPKQLIGLLVSHGHPDHMGGIYSLLATLRLIQYEGEFYIFAPYPCKEVYEMIKLFLKFYKGRLSFTLNYHELKDSVNESLDQFIIKPFTAPHYESTRDQPLKNMPAFSYKITLRDEVIVYSGDTKPSPTLEKEVEECDLAILEATYSDSFQETIENHLDVNYAHYLGKSAKNYLLIHPY